MNSTPLKPFWWRLTAFAWVAWLVTLCWFSSKSELPAMPSWNHVDKIMHAGYFFGGSILLASSFVLYPRTTQLSLKWVMVGVILCMSLIGALDEWHQSYTPGRFGLDLGDWLADTAGSALGAPTGTFLTWWAIRFLAPSQKLH